MTDLSPLANHLWQSTLFAAFVGFLTLALRKNRAPVRYWLWLAASLKFLMPFSLLVALGAQFDWRTAPAPPPPQLQAAMEQLSQPFTPIASPPIPAEPAAFNRTPAVLLCIWLAGVLLVAISWTRQWLRLRAAVRSASPLNLNLPIPAMSTPARLEPGVFGIFRPILLIPQGIQDHLTPAQWRAILAHELCHVRRRDNLTASLHMLVEAVFWFHPFVWWIGFRLVHERERACDEEVLLLHAADPESYAEGILNVCKLYLESPLPCASGVSGSNLKNRIRAIMTGPMVINLDLSRKLLLASAGIAAIAGPIAFGLANAARGQAQSTMAFEVASVKPSGQTDTGMKETHPDDPPNRGLHFQIEHRRVIMPNANLLTLILRAYGIRGCRPFGEGDCHLVSGGPDWLQKDGFTIVAKMPDTAPDYVIDLVQFQNGKAPEVQLMLQALLADRFHLKVHHETRQLPVYALTLSKKGPKIKQADPSEESRPPMWRPSVQPNGIEMLRLIVQNDPIEDVVDLYSKFTDRPLIDRTGLKARYDFTVDYEKDPEGSPFADMLGPSLFKAFEDQTGIKWEASKGPVEILVIDHAERPSSN